MRSNPNVAPGTQHDAVGVVIDLHEAVGEIEWYYPNVDHGQAAGDLNAWAGGGADTDSSTSSLAVLLHVAVGLFAELLRGPELGIPDVVVLTRIETLVTSGACSVDRA
jgi:hypothetical protein